MLLKRSFSLLFLCFVFFPGCSTLQGTRVSTSRGIDEALAELQSGDRLIIEEGRYLFDHTLLVQGKENVEIIGNGEVWLLCEDPYMDVLTIRGSHSVRLAGLKLRHLKPLEEYSCHGSVLSVKESRDISIENCELNGCGAIGLETFDTHDLVLNDSHIHHNSFTAFYFDTSSAFDIQDNIIENNGSFLEQYDSENIVLENNIEENNSGYWD